MRARAIAWMFAAVNTVEPPILELVTVKFLEGDRPWSKERLPLVQDRIRNRLGQLAARLGDADWLDGEFSAGDLMMVSVLLRLRPSAFWTSSRNWLPMWLAGKVGPHTNAPSLTNWQSTILPMVESAFLILMKLQELHPLVFACAARRS